MHPGQYTVLNSKTPATLESAIKEMEYHDDVLSGMGLDGSAKIQIHVGGVYGDKEASINRFIERYEELDSRIKRRLIIENDERSYSIEDCMRIHDEVGLPVILDTLHHSANHEGMDLSAALSQTSRTWRKEDGLQLVDYSSQAPSARLGKHSQSIDREDFQDFLKISRGHDFDVMLEIKDKEHSALKAIELVRTDSRFWVPPKYL